MKRRSCRGLGLVEVAVAVLLVCFAVLGVGRARLVAVEVGASARLQVQATDLAETLLEVSRSNVLDLSGYRWRPGGATPAPALDCFAGACDSPDWGRWNLRAWLQRKDGAMRRDADGRMLADMPTPSACVDISDRWMTITLQWRRTSGATLPLALCSGALDPQASGLRLRSQVGEG